MSRNLTRKEFIKTMGFGTSALFCASSGYGFWGSDENNATDIKGHVFKNDAPDKPWKWSIEGFHYSKKGKNVRCLVCPNRCSLEPGDRSVCRSKVNIDGKLYSLAYGNPCSVHIDPVEKKPLNHFYPQSLIFSIATTGCNFRCLNCQNWEISQKKPEEVESMELFPEDVIREASKQKIPSIAYTYSEATTYYEYTYDTARLASLSGIRNVLVSNGYINNIPLTRLSKFLDGANINLKSFDDNIYQKLNGGHLTPVLNTFKTLHQEGVWFEMTTLMVPTYVDKEDMIKRMCEWILKNLGQDYPLHFLRFFPQYRLSRLPATPVSTLKKMRNLAITEGIRYVYTGNVPGDDGAHTYCHNCKNMLIERKGYIISQFNLNKGCCKFCGTSIPGRWDNTNSKT